MTTDIELPERPYSKTALEAYMQRFVRIIPQHAATREKLRQEFIRFFEALPPEAQILVIEGKARYELGDRNLTSYSKKYKRHEPICGDFHAEKRLTRAAKDSDGTTLRHETTHYLGMLVSGAQQRYSQKPAWHEAFARERQRFNTDPSQRDSHRNTLYYGYLPLAVHLAYDYEEKEKPEEALAEMGTHYFSLLAKGKRKKQADAIIGRLYPFLWPEFRDGFLPRLVNKARAYSARRARMLQNWVRMATSLHNADIPSVALDAREKIDTLLAGLSHKERGALDAALSVESGYDVHTWRDETAPENVALLQKLFPGFQFRKNRQNGKYTEIADLKGDRPFLELRRWADLLGASRFCDDVRTAYALFENTASVKTHGIEPYLETALKMHLHHGLEEQHTEVWDLLLEGKNATNTQTALEDLVNIADHFGLPRFAVFSYVMDTFAAKMGTEKTEAMNELHGKSFDLDALNRQLNANPAAAEFARGAFYRRHASVNGSVTLHHALSFAASTHFKTELETRFGLEAARPAFAPQRNPHVNAAAAKYE